MQSMNAIKTYLKLSEWLYKIHRIVILFLIHSSRFIRCDHWIGEKDVALSDVMNLFYYTSDTSKIDIQMFDSIYDNFQTKKKLPIENQTWQLHTFENMWQPKLFVSYFTFSKAFLITLVSI